MTRRRLRPCLGLPGRPCGRLARASRCPQCAAVWDKRRGTTAQRMGSGWTRLSRDAIRADADRSPDGKARCLRCGTQGDSANPLTADHETPRSRGGGNDPDNLRVLCRRCNSARGTKKPHQRQR